MSIWYRFVCPICCQNAERFDKYSEFWEDWMWRYCSDECYMKSDEYDNSGEVELWLGVNI